jgi:hypothetical protein
VTRRFRTPASYDANTIQHAEAICSARVPIYKPMMLMLHSHPTEADIIGYRRPRLHPLVPHPGTGPGAIRMVCRMLAKEATLREQALARGEALALS